MALFVNSSPDCGGRCDLTLVSVQFSDRVKKEMVNQRDEVCMEEKLLMLSSETAD